MTTPESAGCRQVADNTLSPRPIPSHPEGVRGTNPTLLRKGGTSFRGLLPEARALAREAYALWRELARERSNPYGDHSGCLLAGRMAVDATRWEDGLVILAAIRVRMDEKSSPRWIPEWARMLGGQQREDSRRAERMAAGRDEEDGRRIPGAPDGIDEEVRRVMVAASRAKSRGEHVALDDHICAVCRQFTETRCPTCSRALHARSCPQRHDCSATIPPAAPSPRGELDAHLHGIKRDG